MILPFPRRCNGFLERICIRSHCKHAAQESGAKVGCQCVIYLGMFPVSTSEQCVKCVVCVFVEGRIGEGVDGEKRTRMTVNLVPHFVQFSKQPAGGKTLPVTTRVSPPLPPLKSMVY